MWGKNVHIKNNNFEFGWKEMFAIWWFLFFISLTQIFVGVNCKNWCRNSHNRIENTHILIKKQLNTKTAYLYTRHPVPDVHKGLLRGDVVHDDHTVCFAEIMSRNAAETFLSRRVPELKRHQLVVYCHGFYLEVDPCMKTWIIEKLVNNLFWVCDYLSIV